MSRVEAARWQLLDALLATEPEGATREHLLQRTGLATGSFYRSIKPLLEEGFVGEHQGRYRMPLANLHNYRYKLWKDAEKLYQLPQALSSHILELVEQSRQELGPQLLAVWLVGSAAHGKMHADSDLDFLAVVKKQTLFSPRSAFGINFVTLREGDFRERMAQGDGFVWTALRYGLILEDGALARDCLATWVSPWTRLRPETVDGDWESLEDHFLAQVHKEDAAEARKALQALAVRLARAMLLTLGELPAGKPDLVDACDLYFGPAFTQDIRAVLDPSRSLGLNDMVRHKQRLRDYRNRYEGARFRWSACGRYLYATQLEFAGLSVSILGELLPDRYEVRSKTAHPDLPADIEAMRLADHRRLRVECKSLERELTLEHLERFPRREDGPRMLLVNAYRSVPPRERPAAFWSPEVPAGARELGLELVTSLEFFRAHHQVALEEPERSDFQVRLEAFFPGLESTLSVQKP